MRKSKTKRSAASSPRRSAKRVSAAKPIAASADQPRHDQPSPASKQARVITMLGTPQGATIKSLSNATGWQAHSVRGFLAGVIRKRLKLKLSSEKLDGIRIYRIAGMADGEAASRRSTIT